MNGTSSNYDVMSEPFPRTIAASSNYVALLSFVISVVGFFVPLIVAFFILGRGASATSAALGSVFTNRKGSKQQVLSFIKSKRKVKRRKETEFQDRADFTSDYSDEFSDRK